MKELSQQSKMLKPREFAGMYITKGAENYTDDLNIYLASELVKVVKFQQEKKIRNGNTFRMHCRSKIGYIFRK